MFSRLTLLYSQSGANFLFTYYIPIYFQAIHAMSAADSGIRNIPFIVLSCRQTSPSESRTLSHLTDAGTLQHFSPPCLVWLSSESATSHRSLPSAVQSLPLARVLFTRLGSEALLVIISATKSFWAWGRALQSRYPSLRHKLFLRPRTSQQPLR